MAVEALQDNFAAVVDGYDKSIVDQSMTIGADIQDVAAQIETGGYVFLLRHLAGASRDDSLGLGHL